MQGSECWHEWLPGPRALGAEFLVETLRWGHPRKSCLVGPLAGHAPLPSKHYIVMNYFSMRLFSTHLLFLPARLSAPEWAHVGLRAVWQLRSGLTSTLWSLRAEHPALQEPGRQEGLFPGICVRGQATRLETTWRRLNLCSPFLFSQHVGSKLTPCYFRDF